MENSNANQVQGTVSNAVGGVVEVRVMSKRILELGRMGLNKTNIQKQMLKEGYDKIRYGYIFVVLKNKGVVVPKKEKGIDQIIEALVATPKPKRVRTPKVKEEKVEEKVEELVG